MKKKRIPSIDLSSYNNVQPLPITVSNIIISGLVAYEGDAYKVARHFKLNVEKVNEVYLTVYTSINRAIAQQQKINDISTGINACTDLMTEHVKELKRNRDDKGGKLMSKEMTKNVNSIADRLLKISESNASTYNSSIDKLYDNIGKIKLIEYNTGSDGDKVGANNGYDNATEFANMVASNLAEPAAIKWKSKCKPVRGKNMKTGEIEVWTTITECSDHFHSDRSTIKGNIERKISHKFRNGEEWFFTWGSE